MTSCIELESGIFLHLRAVEDDASSSYCSSRMHLRELMANHGELHTLIPGNFDDTPGILVNWLLITCRSNYDTRIVT